MIKELKIYEYYMSIGYLHANYVISDGQNHYRRDMSLSETLNMKLNYLNDRKLCFTINKCEELTCLQQLIVFACANGNVSSSRYFW